MIRIVHAVAALVFAAGTVVVATPVLDRQALVASAAQPVARG